MVQNCDIPINTHLPLKAPYRTGSYLIYDYDPGDSEKPKLKDCPPPQPDHFREGTSIKLPASGSRQLDAPHYAEILSTVAAKVPQGGKLYVVDLRQESHLFFNNRAVSWYADKDWSNVGQSLDWILNDEACRIDMSRGKMVQIFCTNKSAADDTVIPTGYSDVLIKSAQSEEEIVHQIAARISCPVLYERIPVTDHCMPTTDAVNAFIDLILNLKPERDWIHFHCHGGDGRTTTFLAMYDMFCQAKLGKGSFPGIDEFAERQMKLFCYDLNAAHASCNETTDWKCALVKVRWAFLTAWHGWLEGKALGNQKPFKF